MARHGRARRASAASLLVCIAYLAVDTFFSIPSLMQEPTNIRDLSSTTDSSSDDRSRGLITYEECTDSPIHAPEKPIVPVYAASYPGSGSQMTHSLYEALTGLPAGTDYSLHDIYHNDVAVKTHYPAMKHKLTAMEDVGSIDRAILHLRNPLHALPSFASFVFEDTNGIPNHTVRAPKKFWIEWRDKHFESEIENWVNLLEYWADTYDSEDNKRIVISYEHLLDEETGPDEAKLIGEFLGEGEGVTSVDAELIPCVWDKVVNYEKYSRKLLSEFLVDNEEYRGNNEDNVRRMIETYSEEMDEKVRRLYDDPFHPVTSHRHGPKVEYNFNEEQLQTLLDELKGAKEKYVTKDSEERLETILDGYISAVEDKLKETESSSN